MRILGWLTLALFAGCADKPPALQPVDIPRSYGGGDGASHQPVLYQPASSKGRPALLALHSWSSDRNWPGNKKLAAIAAQHDFSVLAPEFQGPNRNPRAAGSCAVLTDILDARNWLVQNAQPSSIILHGESGGGHAALMALAAWPASFDQVSSWVPITNLVDWHAFVSADPDYGQFRRDLEAIAGGSPATRDTSRQSLLARSPLEVLKTNRTPLLLGLGVRDGVTGSVPVNQGVRMFNALATPADRLSALPAYELAVPESRRLLLEKTSNQVKLALFDMGHSTHMEYLFGTLAQVQPGVSVMRPHRPALPAWCVRGDAASNVSSAVAN